MATTVHPGIWLFLAFSCSVGLSCDSVPTEERPAEAVQGVFKEEARRVLVGGSVRQEHKVGSYGYLTFRFDEDGVVVHVTSDIADEIGEASGTYEETDGGLLIVITESESAKFAPGDSLLYSKYSVLDKDFEIAIGEFRFAGPGLLLASEKPDASDLDGDGDLEEIVTEETYLSRTGE